MNTENEHVFDEAALQKLNKVQTITGHRFNDLTLLASALTHTSGATTRLVSNERLEFLGDAILGAVVVDLLYHECESMMEGEMTQLKSSIVSRAACTRVSQSLGLEHSLFLGKGMEKAKLPPSLLANLQEAIIGAIYLDAGMEVVKGYILRAFAEEIQLAIGGGLEQNFKMILQQRIQKQLHQAPGYRVVDQKGPDHRKCFKVQVKIGQKTFHSAWGKSKKEAEQHAAENALAQLDSKPPVYPADD